MKQAIIAAAVSAILASSLTSVAWDGDDNPAIFFARDRGQSSTYSPPHENLNGSKMKVAQEIANKVRSRMGEEWVVPALKIAKIESSYTCNVRGPKTRHGRAVGPLQVLPSSAMSLGISVADLHSSCIMQIEAGIRHMERCIKKGAKTPAQMSSCHVSGNPFNGRLARKAERYRQQYIRLAVNAKVPQWAGTLNHW